MHRCKYLAHGLYISFDCFRHCHLAIHAPKERNNNFIVPYKGPKDKVDWDRVFQIKQELVRKMRYEDDIPSFCKGCRWLEEFNDESDQKYKSDLENYIDIVWLGHYNECNSKCIYCMSFRAIYNRRMTKDYGVIKLLKEMLNKKIYDPKKVPDSYISFAMGEPTLLKDFDTIIKIFEKAGNKHFAIYSNAIKYSRFTEKILHNNNIDATIVVSLDAGTRNMYKKIKLVDKFDVVCKNIKKYASATPKENPRAVGVKYIIIPKINDTMEEIDKFYDLCVNELNVRYLIADIEEHCFVRDKGVVSENIKEMLRHIRNRCEKDSIEFDFYDRAAVTEL